MSVGAVQIDTYMTPQRAEENLAVEVLLGMIESNIGDKTLYNRFSGNKEST